MPWFQHTADLITRPEIEALLDRTVAEARDRLGIAALRRVLLLPPDITRAHAGVGWMTEYLFTRLDAAGAEVHVIPTLGQHVPHTEADNRWMFGSIPQDRIVVTGGFRPWRDVEIGARATMLNGQDDVPQGTLPVGGATVFDLFALYTPSSGSLEGATFAFGIDNVLDREYRIYPNGLNQTGIAVKASAAMEF